MDAPATQPSDEEITAAVWEMLRENMDISRNEIKTQLETNFNWELAEKKVSYKQLCQRFCINILNQLIAVAVSRILLNVIHYLTGSVKGRNGIVHRGAGERCGDSSRAGRGG